MMKQGTDSPRKEDQLNVTSNSFIMDQSQINRFQTGKFTVKPTDNQGEGNTSRVTNINNTSNFMDDNTRLMELLSSNCHEN